MVYEYELRCNELTERYYLSHEQDLRDLSLLSFKMVDEQRDLGTRTADVLLNNQVILKYKTILPSGKIVSYVYTGEDIAKITKGSSLTSEKALLSYVKTIIGAASASLPIVTTEDGEPVVDQVPDPLKYIILKDIQLQGKDVVFSFSTPEINFSVSDAKKGSNDEAEVKAILDELIKDQYFKEHINFFAMAKCNLIFRYKGARTSQSLEIRFPYAMLRESSYIPKYLLDENNF